MKILKNVLIVIAVIIAIPLVIALFVTKDYNLSKEIVINKPKQQVFDYIRFLKNQDNFSEWNMMDPNMKKTYSGTDGTEGFVYAWDSEKAGAGEMKIKDISEGESVNVGLHFIRPVEGEAVAPFRVEAVDSNNTKVTWGISGQSSYPMNFMNLFTEQTMGGPIQNSLVRLKAILEKQ